MLPTKLFKNVADEWCYQHKDRCTPRERIRDALRQIAVNGERNGEGRKEP